ncbi:MAG: alpha-ribazole phosphatase [Salinivirgaceae bacterium]|jgi:alpha-ribazole phosphatase|nr:alpha-ribazole phosphatase [Salinivirgaceae bacterium]
MHIYLLRHTQVDVPKGTCYGQTDVRLAKSFPDESNRIIEQLKGIEIDHFYTSPLTRCELLAEKIEQKLAIQPFIKDARLKELNFGDWERQLWNDIEKTDTGKQWFDDWVNNACPNGESYLQLGNRVNDFLTEIKQKGEDKSGLVVTHGGVIRAFHAIVNEIPLKNAFDLEVDFGQIIKIMI